MLRCSHCGTPNHPQARACYACARPLWHATPAREDRTLQIALGVLGGLFLVGVLVVVVGFFMARSFFQRVVARAATRNPPAVTSPQVPPFDIGERPRTYVPPMPQIEPPSTPLPDPTERFEQDMERMRQAQERQREARERQREQIEARQREVMERHQRLLREHQERMDRRGSQPMPLTPPSTFRPVPAPPQPEPPEATVEYLPLSDHLRPGVAIYQGQSNRRWGRVLALDDNHVEPDGMGGTRRYRAILIAPAAGPPRWHDRDSFDFSNLYVRSDDPLIRFGR